MVYRSMWKITKDKKIEVAMKILKDESSERFLKVNTCTTPYCFDCSNNSS